MLGCPRYHHVGGVDARFHKIELLFAVLVENSCMRSLNFIYVGGPTLTRESQRPRMSQVEIGAELGEFYVTSHAGMPSSNLQP